MAAIHQLIDQIEDARLRDRLRQEADVLTQGRSFGLVFERHLPEVTPIYGARPRRGDTVAVHGEPLTDLWRVQRVSRGQAECVNLGRNNAQAWSLDQLLVVRSFGEPIFPSLVALDKVANGPSDAPWHTLIEADNYHALQLLEYLYAGQVDCIYIDPPYNTGARDWKYNNDYVDQNDAWRHSKWLAFMEKRLRLAKRLLKPNIGVLICTIDEHEVHHLGMLMEQVFAGHYQQTVTIVINQKGVAQGRLSRAEEYAIYCFSPEVALAATKDDLLSPDRPASKGLPEPRWERLLRGGTNSRREDRYGLFFPIFVDPTSRRIVEIGDPIPRNEAPKLKNLHLRRVAWPLRTDGSLGNWRVSPPTLREFLKKGYVKLGGFDEQRNTWTVLYLGRKAQSQIESGAIEIIGHDAQSGAVDIAFSAGEQKSVKTVWHRATHDAGTYGSTMLRSILGSSKFAFPKSLYATQDAVASVVRDRPEALIVDFFAGSGTTLNAVNLLNTLDGGRRRCILVTNNEVSAEEFQSLLSRGFKPGQNEWESQGICRSVTWPRSKFTILGHRDDGTPLAGDYITGQTREVPGDRRFRHINFVDSTAVNTTAKRKQLVALIEGLPQSLVIDDKDFVVSEDHAVSVLFDDSQANEWLEALDEQDHITDFVIVAPRKGRFDEIKSQIIDLLGSAMATQEVRRPISEGFAANLEYFRLDFLDPEQVALKHQFREVLPLLWMRAGCIGPRPALAARANLPAWLVPDTNRFAVLLDESRFRAFRRAVQTRTDLTHVFLVTDSEEAFQEMAGEFPAETTPVQLYRDYLENFLINRGGRR